MQELNKIRCGACEELMRDIDSDRKTWVDALPDKLALPCSICGCRVDFDYTVDDAFWNRIVPLKQRYGVICLNCLDVMATSKKENICDHIKKIFYCGEGKTMVLFCKNVYHYKKHR